MSKKNKVDTNANDAFGANIFGELNLTPSAPEPESSQPVQSGRLGEYTLALEKKGRGGKTVTVIHFKKPQDPPLLKALLKLLQRTLGVGGAHKENTIELQGDCQALVHEHLPKLFDQLNA